MVNDDDMLGSKHSLFFDGFSLKCRYRHVAVATRSHEINNESLLL